MSGSTSVPSISFTNQGFVAPAQTAILAGAQADINAAFNGVLNQSLKTPQGQLAMSEAAIIGNADGQQVSLFNGMDPARASGRQQDGIARIYFLTRNPAQSTVLQVLCNGLVGATVPVNAQVTDPNQNIYLCTGAGQFASTGNVTLSFAAIVPGPLPVPASVTISQSQPGWNTATLVSGVVGNAAETRAAFEARRAASVAVNGAGFPPAIAGAVGQVPGVIDFYVYSNDTNSPVTVQGVTVAANSLYVCVAGGASAAIAQAIWTKKNPGCSYTGNTSVTVYDTNSGYSTPYPSYTVTYEVPTGNSVCMNVVIKNSAQVPSNAATLIQGAVQAAFTGQDGGMRARIGSEIFASRFYAGIAALGSWAQIVSLQIGQALNSPAAAFTGAISGTTLTVSSVTGTIAIGQFVYAIGGVNTVASGTIIVSGSGTSWQVSVNQTVTSVSMFAVAAAYNDTTMQINQIPTLANADVNVTLGS